MGAIRARCLALEGRMCGLPLKHRALPLLVRPSYASIGRQRFYSDEKSDASLQKHDTVTSLTSINPPRSTRPPVLTLPTPTPGESRFKRLLAFSKAYFQFYKAGCSAVLTNYRLAKEVIASKSGSGRDTSASFLRQARDPAALTRAEWILLSRVRHDVLRIPLFGIILLICWEMTPIVVAVFDGVVPTTCRLPFQNLKAIKRAEERRRVSFEELDSKFGPGVADGSENQITPQYARTHTLRSLHLISGLWDRLGFVPSYLWRSNGEPRIAYLEADDALLSQANDLSAMEPEEVEIACAERGINVQGQSPEDLQRSLSRWLELTASGDGVERRKRMTVLLTTRYVFLF